MILTRPFIWLVAPLVPSFILSICHTAEHASIVQLWLMLKVCRPLMWRFSEGDFNRGATGDWRRGDKQEDFRLYLIGGEWTASPEELQGYYQKCTKTQSVLCVFSVRAGLFACIFCVCVWMIIYGSKFIWIQLLISAVYLSVSVRESNLELIL